ncbi:MAG: glycosyltransferase family 2 protein [Clostridia bacterium]|nr:glycosyltransferase family 2 protein [Clostridia bacterium]
MDLFVEILFWCLKLLTFYTGFMGILFFLPRRKFTPTSPVTRFAVLIPARNEESVIENIVKNIKHQNYTQELYDIIVIPNNCEDDTAGAAQRAGAKIFSCTGTIRGKGDVLHQVFEQLMGQYDAYCVFDADNLVDPDFLARMNDAVVGGALVAKGRQKASNPYDSWMSGCYDIYMESANTLHSRPRESLGLNAKLIGTGFMVTDKLMQQMGGWNAFTITEDTEFAAQCALNNVRIHYVPEAIHYDEQPTGFGISMRQRRRWSAGVQIVANRYVPRLLLRCYRFRTLDFTIFVNMIYVQMLLLIPAVYELVGLTGAELWKTLLISVASFWGGSMALALFMCITARRNVIKMLKSILLYPIYVASWYPLHFIALFVKPKKWTTIPHTGKTKVQMK